VSIFDRIKNAIFGEAHATETSAVGSISPDTSTPPTAAANAPAATQMASQASASPAQASSTPSPTAPTASVDVAPILDAAVKKSGQKLDWKHSIVDLMKALGMDATLEERKELAAELDYRGDLHDSATMNTFLHKALLQKLAQNGGKVPAELLN
jgi:hypothetical protein